MADTRPTQEYSSFDQAYDFFNARLFEGKLPLCLITLQRKSKAFGYFSGDRFVSRNNGNEKIDEIALNPDTFERCTDQYIISTLVHEMTHVWQYRLGRRPRKAYHDRQWADKMEEIGLCPSTTGQPGGARTGQKCSHYLPDEGPFIDAWNELLGTGFKLNWQSNAPVEEKKETKPSKVKYTCPECEQNAWAKPEASLVCGDCMERMESEE